MYSLFVPLLSIVCSLCNTVSDGLWSVERSEQLQASQREFLFLKKQKEKERKSTMTPESFSSKKFLKKFSSDTSVL